MHNDIKLNIEIIIDEYSNYVFKIVDNIIGHSLPYQDKEEIVADVFYLLWKHQHNITKDLKSYLSVIARNCSYSKLRSLKTTLEYQDYLVGNDNLSSDQINFDDIFLIKQKLLRLSLEEQNIFRLYYIEGYKIKEIASKLNIKINLVKVRLCRIRDKVKEDLK